MAGTTITPAFSVSAPALETHWSLSLSESSANRPPPLTFRLFSLLYLVNAPSPLPPPPPRRRPAPWLPLWSFLFVRSKLKCHLPPPASPFHLFSPVFIVELLGLFQPTHSISETQYAVLTITLYQEFITEQRVWRGKQKNMWKFNIKLSISDASAQDENVFITSAEELDCWIKWTGVVQWTRVVFSPWGFRVQI